MNSWITEAEELEDLYGDRLPIAFLRRLAWIKKNGPDEKLLQEAREYVQKIPVQKKPPEQAILADGKVKAKPRSPVDAFVIGALMAYISQIDGIKRSEVTKREKIQLIRWRTGTHGESGAGYRLNATLRTESNAAVNAASMNAYKAAGIERYRCVEVLDDKTCGYCWNIHGKVFKVSEAVRGVNMSPFHPNCRGFSEPVID